MRLLVLVLVAVGFPLLASPAVSSAGAAVTDDTYATFYRNASDELGAKEDLLWRSPDSAFSATGSPGAGVTLIAGRGSDSAAPLPLTLEFTPPSGQQLTSGTTYTDSGAPGASTPSQAGMAVHMDNLQCEGSGDFTVHDLSRVWISYTLYCGDRWGAPAVWGEIKYHEPSADPDVVVAPSSFAFPRTYFGDSIGGGTHQVFVLGRGVAPVTMGTAELLSGQGSFFIESDACSGHTVSATSYCTIDVRYQPTGVGSQTGLLRIPDDSAAGHHDVPLAGVGYAGHTGLRAVSNPADPIGRGQTIVLDDPPADFGFDGADYVWTGDVFLAHHRLGFDISNAPYGQNRAPLRVGKVYATQRRTSSSTSLPATFSADVDYRSGGDSDCSPSYGAFRVDQATSSNGIMTSFALVYEQRCGSPYGPPMYGSLAWHAQGPLSPVPTHALDQVPSSLGLAASRTSVTRGHAVGFGGVLEDRSTRKGLVGRYVRLVARAAGSSAWHQVAYTRTDRTGRYHFVERPSGTTEYRARFTGDDTWAAVLSSGRAVRAVRR